MEAPRAVRSTAKRTTFPSNIVRDPIHISDFHATILHLVGFDHQRFTYKFQGLDQRLTGVEEAHVIHDLLA